MTPAGNVISNGGMVDPNYVFHDPPQQIHEPLTPRQRKFLPGVADLVDRLTISLQKQIFVTGQAEHYKTEVADILNDIDLIISSEGHVITADAVRWIAVIMLANHFIWQNESKIRAGSATLPPEELAKRLQATHMINGVRNSAKNMLACLLGGRQDFKIDCFAADEAWNAVFGNWNIFTT